MSASPVPTAVPLDRLVGFGRYLRSLGLPVGTGRILTFCRAAAALDPFDRTDLRWAARTTLISRPDQRAELDAAFDRYFGRGSGVLDLPIVPDEELAAALRTARGSADDDPERELALASSWSTLGSDEEAEGESAIRIVASDAEVLRTKDFAEMTDLERRAVSQLIRRVVLTAPLRPSRRYRAASRGDRFDLRRTLRASLRTQGEPFERAWRRRRTRRRPLVLILDVSGSMSAYSRALIEFAHAAARTGQRVEVFTFGTKLTRITRALRSRDPGEALHQVGSTVTDWEGGTRIGQSLRELLDTWSARSALRGSLVVLCSDVLERGDPELLARQMERLSRLAHRIVWRNPLTGSPRYEPLARGMAASLPHVDRFLSGHNLASLEALAGAMASA
jgi:uncharacterized protein with von Willebrand factor type A (vWA) domain